MTIKPITITLSREEIIALTTVIRLFGWMCDTVNTYPPKVIGLGIAGILEKIMLAMDEQDKSEGRAVADKALRDS